MHQELGSIVEGVVWPASSGYFWGISRVFSLGPGWPPHPHLPEIFPVLVLQVLSSPKPRMPGKLGQVVTLWPSHHHLRNFCYEGSGVKNKSDNILALKCRGTTNNGNVPPLPIQIRHRKQTWWLGDYSFSTQNPCSCSSFLLEGPPSAPHPPAQILRALQSQLKSLFLFEIFPNHPSWKWSALSEKYNSVYCLCTHAVYINSYFRIRTSLREIRGNLEMYSFMCNSFILPFVCKEAPSVMVGIGDSKMNRVLSLQSPPLARWDARLCR